MQIIQASLKSTASTIAMLGVFTGIVTGCATEKKSTAPGKGKPATLRKDKEKKVREAAFSKTNITAEQIAELAKHKTLRQISFYECTDISDGAIRELAKLERVDSLHLLRCDIDDKSLNRFQSMPHVKHLILTNAGVTKDGIAALNNWEKLTQLTLGGNQTKGVLRGVSGIERLEVLEILITTWDMEDLKGLTLPNLRTLKLANQTLTDEHLMTFPNWPALERIEVLTTKITDRGVKRLAKFSSLKELSLAESKVTDEGVKHLLELTNLERLNLQDCVGVTNQSLKTIANMPALKWVSVERTSITGDALMDVSSSKTLRYFAIGHKKATKTATDKLAKAMPNCKIDRIKQNPD